MRIVLYERLLEDLRDLAVIALRIAPKNLSVRLILKPSFDRVLRRLPQFEKAINCGAYFSPPRVHESVGLNKV
jgi:hypothetical protein